uniref:Beta-sarcoglycan n=1 Tax=Timema cristinae TaxID=61476 RepID=A0A7R9D9L4_TIMCR|nr:unnamed protein product [Timema cristinae]
MERDKQQQELTDNCIIALVNQCDNDDGTELGNREKLDMSLYMNSLFIRLAYEEGKPMLSGRQGMESLELVPEESLVVFYGNTDLDKIYKRDGKLEGFDECPVELTGDNGSVFINVIDSGGKGDPKISVGLNSTFIAGIKSFEVRDPMTGHPIFSTGFPNFGLPRGVEHLDVKMVQTHRITSPVSSSLDLQADKYAFLRGNEGTHVDGREIVWSADQDIFLKSVNGSVILSGREGVSLDVKNIPVAQVSPPGGNSRAAQFKVCVCMPGGKLFRVPVPVGKRIQASCNHVDISAKVNPCM